MGKQTCYLITRCSQCQTPFYFRPPQKTKRCPRCNALLTLSKLNILYKVDHAEDALKIILKLKQPGTQTGFVEASKIMDGEQS
ncbi:MAG: DUF1922 domain-containing protein [Candidatus Odinarchaeum yellowstonii]|jgi:hypothetical protein|uniref:DUF1922 domain-containing protein n=1 Tax=Odinarchaeota yellowstonii (strain LCB_4) TaxID=1841599 RepID=A0AAF0D1F8_ODILC|nr:MAG: DUF1922 domain-containing protein [Candidatus Odinarchaeum yellowstonii]